MRQGVEDAACTPPASCSPEASRASICRILPTQYAGSDEVIVELVTAALNRRDWWLWRAPGTPTPVMLGSDGAGRVAAVGAGVRHVSPGDEVVIDPTLHWGDDERAASAELRHPRLPDRGDVRRARRRPGGQRTSQAPGAELGGGGRLSAGRPDGVARHGHLCGRGTRAASADHGRWLRRLDVLPADRARAGRRGMGHLR